MARTLAQLDTLSTTSPGEVAAADQAAAAAAQRVADYAADMASGKIEPSADAKMQFSRLVQASELAKQDAAIAAEEQSYDTALVTAADMAQGDVSFDDERYILAGYLSQALAGKINLRISPPHRVNSDSKYGVTYHEPVKGSSQNRSYIELSSTLTGPVELVDRLYSPPPSRRLDTFNPMLPDTFATTTGTTNAPRITDFYTPILHQNLYPGSLIDPNVVNLVMRPDTEPWQIASYGGRPAVTVRTDENAAITSGDFTFNEITFQAHEMVAQHEISKKFEMSAQDPNVIASMWEELTYELHDEQNTAATVGAGGANAPTGCETAAAAAYTGNQNRIQIKATGTNAITNPTLDYLTQGIGLLNNRYRMNGKFGIQLHNQWGHDLIRNTAKNFPSNSMYEWLNYMDPSHQAMYFHLGRPVYENPNLAATNSAGAKLAVGGDFSKFWVVLRPMDIFTSEHVEARKRQIFIQIAQYMDSNVVQWSYDVSRPGPLFYIRGN